MSLPNTTVVSATKVAATSDVPEYCDVQLTVNNPPSDDQVRVGVFLPTRTWNRRFMGTGGGGLTAGDPSVPCGVVLGLGFTPCAISAGYATAGTDAGSPQGGLSPSNPDGTLNRQLIEDFGHLGIHQMTTTAQDVIAAYYGTGPTYSYFNGSSTGGRQGIMEAQRYPTDYNGILAAEPAINFTKMVPASLWPQLVMKWAGNFMPQPKFETVNEEVVAACDGLDRVEDGIISDWEGCRPDARDYVGTATANGPITRKDAEVVNKIWEGPRGLNGELLWYGLLPGTPFGGPTSQVGGLANTVTWWPGFTTPQPFGIAPHWFTHWLERDPW